MPRKSESDDSLLTFLWAFDTLTRPNMRRLLETYEAWEYRNYGRHQLERLERNQLVVRHSKADQAVYSLSDLGRLKAVGGRHPPTQWQRAWDGQWRLVLFDLPINRPKLRLKLWRWLRENRFGYLQQSAWICPDPLEEVRTVLQEYHDEVENLTVLESRAAAGYTDSALVNGAWDFAEINARYEGYCRVATDDFQALQQAGFKPDRVTEWLRAERAAWLWAAGIDPLLPAALLPRAYHGRSAWHARQHAFQRLAKAVG